MSERENYVEALPRRIWLLLGEGKHGTHVWCDDPNPSGSSDHVAVEYMRADTIGRKKKSPMEPRP